MATLACKLGTRYVLLFGGTLLLAIGMGATIAYAPRILGDSGSYMVAGAFLVAVGVVVILLKWQVGAVMLPALLPYEGIINLGPVASGIKAIALLTLFSLALSLLRDQRLLERFLRLWQRPLTLTALVFLCWVFASVTWASQQEAALAKMITFTGVFSLMVIIGMLEERYLELMWLTTALSAVISIPAALLSSQGEAMDTGGRFSGEAIDPNEYACLLVIVFLVTYFGLRRNKILTYILAPILFFGIFASLSRTGLITLVAAPILAVLIPRSSIRLGGRTLLMYGLGTLALAAIILAIPWVGENVWERYMTLLQYSNQETWSGRWDIWRGALKVVISHPFLGVGTGNFPYAAVDYSQYVMRLSAQGEQGGVAHNVLLSVASELGLIGLALFLGILFFAFRSLFLITQRSTLGTGVFLGLVAFTIAGMALTWEDEKIGWVLLGSVLSLHLQPSAQHVPLVGRQENRR